MDVPQGYPKAAAVSPRLQWVATTGSTNADLVRDVAEDPSAWPHLSALVTNDQRAGRGRLDRTWVAPAGTALAVSVVVDAAALPPQARGWVPLVAGAAMTRAVTTALGTTALDVVLKWPNDVLVGGGKISGILAEAVPGEHGRIVVGAGVNTRMTPADLPVASATSFAAVGVEVDEDALLADYLSALDGFLRRIAEAGGDVAASGVAAEIAHLCGTLGRDVRVALPDGEDIVGRAIRLDPDGRLVVAGVAAERVVAAGDVVHVR